MGLNPGSKGAPLIERILRDNIRYGESPYFGMFNCGYHGISFDDVVSYASRVGVPLREKDIQSWKDGMFKRNMSDGGAAAATLRQASKGMSVESMHIVDFPLLPQGWHGTSHRFFPCTSDNKPMQKWGWTREFSPNLYTMADAKALSPCGWVGQNMLYQRFIVVDIDGVGHGTRDDQVIEFGRRFSDRTMTMEDPAKQGSFHLYFETDRLIPVRHYGWAKIDLMGNAVNAAVYLKSKVSNGLPMMEFDEQVWQALVAYQNSRKETCI